MFASQIVVALMRRVQIKDYEPFEARVEMTFHLEEQDDLLVCGSEAIRLVRERLTECFTSGRQQTVAAPISGSVATPQTVTQTPVVSVPKKPTAADLDL